MTVEESNTEELIHHRLTEVTRWPTCHNSTPLHRVITIRLPDEMQVLFHQQNSDTCLSNNAPNGSFYVLHDVGLNAFGGFIEQKQLGPAKKSPGDRKLLLLTAAEITPFAGQKLPQDRKRS